LVSWTDDEELDVLLVVPPPPSVYAPDAVKTPEYSSPPLGLSYIAAVLRQHGFHVAILDLHQSAGKPEDVVGCCREGSPKVVGITAATPSYPNALRVARFVKAWNPDVITVLGGPHATGLPDECARSEAFDYVCIGEGEESMSDLVEALIHGGKDPRAVVGFVHQWNGRAVHTGSRGYVSYLDDLPLPARELLDLGSYYQKGAIISSRGCPIGCSFCACAAIVGNTYRIHSITRVLEEIGHVTGRYGYRFFDFHDDTFNLQPERVFEFCREVVERRLSIEWGCFCRAAQMTPEMARAMANAGCRVIQFGVESGNDSVLQSLQKQTSTTQIEAAVRAVAAAGIEQIVCGFIIGHATDTEDSSRETIKFGLHLRDLGATRLTLSLLTPYPGTRVYERREQLGIRLLTDDWEQYTFSRVVMETSRLNRDKLRELYVEGLLSFLDATIK
jgi:radical SAM superfamily enzyme YgiQ (UPF0313 family)